MTSLNIDDVVVSNEAGSEIRNSYERGRRVSIPKTGELFELPYGDSRLKPQCQQWVLGIDDTTLRIKPADFGTRGWMLLNAAMFFVGTLFALFWAVTLYRQNPSDSLIIVVPLSVGAAIFAGISVVSLAWSIRQPLGWPVIFNRRTSRVVQMQGRQVVSADWSSLRPFVERVYNAQGAPFWKLRLLQVGAAGEVQKNLVMKLLAPGPEGCASYFEYLRRYMDGSWTGLPDTLLVHGMRRSLLRQFRNDFGWMFGKRRAWNERPFWLKALTFILMPVLTTIFWPVGFFVMLGSRLGWAPQFPPDVEAEAKGGKVPAELASRIHNEPALASFERLFYGGIMIFATAIWIWLGVHYFELLHAAWR